MIRYLQILALAVTISGPMLIADANARTTISTKKLDVAIFSGGCFWCMEKAFEGQPGVMSVVSGYIGGTKKNPTYTALAMGKTRYAEAIRVAFDPTATNYAALLTVFWRNIDPVSAGGQFCDRGAKYRSGIFTVTTAQHIAATKSKQALVESKRFKRPIVTEITTAGPFIKAPEKHQDFYKKKPARYRSYRKKCGRDARLKELWGSTANH